MRSRILLAVAGLALLTAACAGGPPERGGRGRGGFGPPGGPGFEGRGRFGDDDEDGPRRPRTQLFISPSGQPFRAPMGAPYPVAAWFAQADRNHDGRLTLDEFRADADAYFDVLDTDKDGQISMPETTRWEEVLVPEIARDASGVGGGFEGGGFGGGRGRRGGGGGGGGGENALDTRRQGAGAYSLINEPHPIRGADADFSMSVSRAEWRAAADRRFALLDKDHDGAITLEELPPTPMQYALERMANDRHGRRGRGEGGRPGEGGGPPPR